ncbi:hypothetical protein DESPIG_02042 [Desulfovibrio piger ATCC 29098]|uniref:Uncharacterized protein n=1 Tax=Desulfovibrio piger ATCC 29098 TaxID=411464 RepID=B6WVC6_9BACT|nr:hypothetical protein DESPIG_02042 [Desulfovibrio piger ATCC 29098]
MMAASGRNRLPDRAATAAQKRLAGGKPRPYGRKKAPALPGLFRCSGAVSMGKEPAGTYHPSCVFFVLRETFATRKAVVLPRLPILPPKRV